MVGDLQSDDPLGGQLFGLETVVADPLLTLNHPLHLVPIQRHVDTLTLERRPHVATDRKAGQVRYWQYGLAWNSPNLAKSDPSRFPLPPSRFPLLAVRRVSPLGF